MRSHIISSFPASMCLLQFLTFNDLNIKNDQNALIQTDYKYEIPVQCYESP